MTTQIDDMTPVIIGVGQFQMDVPEQLENAPGPIEVTAHAIKAAFLDTGVEGIVSHVDSLTSIRIFSDSGPIFPCPFGRSNNLPASISKAAGIKPKRLVYSKLGGDQPQVQVAETAKALQSGDTEMAIICGGEAIANMKAAMRADLKLDWSDDPTVSDKIETIDYGFDFSDLPINPQEVRHGLFSPISLYALIETGYRLRQKTNLETYRQEIGIQFAPFAKIAAKNPYAMFKSELSASDIATPSQKNPRIASPYTKAMVAKDGVNQGAAVIMTTVGRAKSLNIPSDTWVFLNGYAKGSEPNTSERPQIYALPVLEQVVESALKGAEIEKSQIQNADFYSCFPIVIFNSIPLLKEAKIKQHTLTGGLPFFGGPGNNYSLHAIAEMVKTLRGTDQYGLIHANGGIMTKHAVGIYSTHASDFSETEVNYEAETVEIVSDPQGHGKLVSYSLTYKNNIPQEAVILAKTAEGLHALAKFEGDLEQLETVRLDHPIELESGRPHNIARLMSLKTLGL